MIRNDSVCELEGDLIMKKIIALVLALALLTLTGAALATGSNDGDKYNTATTTTTTTTTTNAETKKAFIFDFSDKKELIEWANSELAKLKEAESVKAYFGLADEVLGEGEYFVNELQPVYAANYEESMGEQEIKLTFATPYEKDASVLVMLGFKAGDGVAWNTFAGKVADGSAIVFKLDPATILRVQENNALLAIVNK